jgi:hypothetical protein
MKKENHSKVWEAEKASNIKHLIDIISTVTKDINGIKCSMDGPFCKTNIEK